MKTEIVIFDYDGTLTKSEKGTNSWFNMWKALDDLKTDEKLYSMFKRGEITHREWFSLIIDHLKEKRVTSSFFKQLAKKTVLIDGVGDLFKMLYENNVEIYILSSGIKNLIDQTLSGLKKYITDIQGYEILFDKLGVVSAGKNVDFLDEQKDDFIKKIINPIAQKFRICIVITSFKNSIFSQFSLLIIFPFSSIPTNIFSSNI